MAPAVLVFAKFPAPGQVKTRLASRIGEEPAARFAESFLLDVLTRVSKAPGLNHARLMLFFDPFESRAAFKGLLKAADLEGWELFAQSPGDLGARMRAAYKHLIEEGSVPAVFLGADCPDLPAETIEKALKTAEGGRAAMHPAADGGYVLLALPAGAPDTVFEGVPWSVPQTGARQFNRLSAVGLEVELGESYTDVDTHADLCALKERLAYTPSRCPRTWKTLHELNV